MYVRTYKSLLALAAVFAVGVLSVAPGARADGQITLANSTQQIVLTSLGGGLVQWAMPNPTSGLALDDLGGVGTYSFVGATFVAGPELGTTNTFPIPGNEAQPFSYSGGGNSLSGLVNWNFVADSTANPRVFGNIAVTALAGSAAFTTAWQALSGKIDFTMNNIGQIYHTLADCERCTAAATISSGQLVPVPLPGALPMLGGGLVLMGLLKRRKKRPVETA
jgi:hypothetical protein